MLLEGDLFFKEYSLSGIRKLLSLSTTNQGVLLQMNVWIPDLKEYKKI
jgi:hypothetical protein